MVAAGRVPPVGMVEMPVPAAMPGTVETELASACPTGSPALTMFFNTIVLNNISIPTGIGGYAGSPGTAGLGGMDGSYGSDGAFPEYGFGGGIYRYAGSVINVSHDPGRQSGRHELYELLQCLHESLSIWWLEPDRECKWLSNHICRGYDQSGVTTVSLALGPLQVNLADPPTHALLPGSIATQLRAGWRSWL